MRIPRHSTAKAEINPLINSRSRLYFIKNALMRIYIPPARLHTISISSENKKLPITVNIPYPIRYKTDHETACINLSFSIIPILPQIQIRLSVKHAGLLKVGRALNYVLVHHSHKYIPHSNHKEIAQSVHNHGVNNTF